MAKDMSMETNCLKGTTTLFLLYGAGWNETYLPEVSVAEIYITHSSAYGNLRVLETDHIKNNGMVWGYLVQIVQWSDAQF